MSFRLEADKIDDVGRDRMLPAEAPSVDLARPQVAPQDALNVGLIAPQIARALLHLV
jgi:hypothetical protein